MATSVFLLLLGLWQVAPSEAEGAYTRVGFLGGPRGSLRSKLSPSYGYDAYDLTSRGTATNMLFYKTLVKSCVTPHEDKGICQPLVKCASYYLGFQAFDALKYGACDDVYGVKTFCCPEVLRSSAKAVAVIPDQEMSDGDIPISSLDLYNAMQYSRDAMKRHDEYEQYLQSQGYTMGQDSLYWAASRLTTRYSHICYRGMPALQLLEATDYLKKKYHLSSHDVTWKLNARVHETLLPNCTETVQCYEIKYRPIDGSCNNLKNPTWGKSFTALDRIIPPAYSDGIWGPRKSSDMSDLPNPRLIRTFILPVADTPFKGVGLYVMNWGQFVSHDLSHVPNYQYPNGDGIECCHSSGARLHPREMHPQCYPIYVDSNDAMYGRFGQRCLSITRAVVTPTEDCLLGYANQMNQVTHWLDLSSVYGSTFDVSYDIRSFEGGRLKFSVVEGEEMPPINPGHEDCPNATRNYCFKAGDIRSNQQPGLVVIHTLMLRFHNQVANELSHINVHWDDETLYQEARRIVIAVYQHITYNEYLPLLLGYHFLRGNSFITLTSGHSNDYNEEERPMILNEFAAASYRMGHSLVWGQLKLLSEYAREEESIPLRFLFNNPRVFHNRGVLDKVVRGYLANEARFYDRNFDEEISNHLFQGEGKFGLDLPTINIHRGRDHGLPGYNHFREFCNLTKARYFEDFLDVMTPEDVHKLKSVYKTVDDVDLFVGGSLEKLFPDSLLGQTFWCIVGAQFQKLKVSDRFFYDVGGQHHSFSSRQLDEIRKMTLSRLICETTGVSHLQPLAFRLPYKYANPIVSCSDKSIMTEMSLFPWKEYGGRYGVYEGVRKYMRSEDYTSSDVPQTYGSAYEEDNFDGAYEDYP